MVLTDLPEVLSLIQDYGYWAMFFGTIVEGPVFSATGAFAASFGLLNIFMVIFFSFLGEVIADSAYFFIGKKYGNLAIKNYERRWRMKNTKLRWLKKKLKRHFLLSVAIMKLTPLLAPPGIMLVGSSKISFRKFILTSLMVVVPVSLFYICVGFYLGVAFETVLRYFKIAREILLVAIVVIAVIAYLIQQNIDSSIVKKLSSLTRK